MITMYCVFAVPKCGSPIAKYRYYPNTNFYGGDYKHVWVDQTDATCAAQCSSTPECKGFVTVRSKTQPADGHCWFKSTIGASRAQQGQDAYIACTESGVYCTFTPEP